MQHLRMALCVFALSSVSANAADLEKSASSLPLSITAGADLASAYVFRGFTVNKKPAVQPAMKVQMGGFTAGVWGSLATDVGEAEIKDEVDLYASYDLPINLVTLTAGYTEYLYPDSELDNDQELMLKASLGTMLSPSIAAYRGIGGGIEDSSYYEMAAKQEIFAMQGFSSTLGATLGYLDRSLGDDGLSHLTISAGAAYAMITASVNYVAETDKKVNDLTEQEQLFIMSGASFTF